MNSYPFERSRDMEKVIELLLTCKANKSIDHFLPFMLRLVLTPSSFLSSVAIDLATDVRIWKRSDGTVCGFALVDLSVWGLFYLVSPSEEGGELEQEILSWACNRASHISQGESVTLKGKTRANSQYTGPGIAVEVKFCGASLPTDAMKQSPAEV